MNPAASVAMRAKITVRTCVSADSELCRDSADDLILCSCWGGSINLSSAVIRSPYLSNSSIMIPLVHPKPICTSYSPPPPCPPGTVASYCKDNVKVNQWKIIKQKSLLQIIFSRQNEHCHFTKQNTVIREKTFCWSALSTLHCFLKLQTTQRLSVTRKKTHLKMQPEL